jgi:hypothetical protein
LVTLFNLLIEFSRIISSYTVDKAYAHGGLQKRDKILKIFGVDVFSLTGKCQIYLHFLLLAFLNFSMMQGLSPMLALINRFCEVKIQGLD